MTKQPLLLTSLTLGLAALAFGQAPPTKVGIINIQSALIGTADGKKAVTELQAKFEPTSKKLEGMRDEITALQAELSKGSNTMGEERRRELARDIDQKTRALNRATEDAQADFQQEQEKILQDLGQKMMAIINKYSNDNGYTLVLDVSNPSTPVLFAANGIEITQEVVRIYDEQSSGAQPSTAATAPAAPTQ